MGITERARAKLNLTLNIHGRRRGDGYHLLESLTVFPDLHDTVAASPAPALTLALDGEFAAEAGGGEGNLVLKAARALQAHTGTLQGAALALTKNIPVGAGLGGGSADAAATLRALNQLWQVNLPEPELIAIARPLGADVAMCVASRPVLARGIGDELVSVDARLPHLHLLLVHPRTPLLTPDVYRALHAPFIDAQPPLEAGITIPGEFAGLMQYLQARPNLLEAAACKVSRDVETILETLKHLTPRAGLVRMSGSGACCYAIYETEQDAAAALYAVHAQQPHWWSRTASL